MTLHHESLVLSLNPDKTPELNASAMAVLRSHAFHANESALSWPLIPTIKRETRLSESSITRSHRLLEKHGWLVRKRRRDNSTIYRLNVTKLEHYRLPQRPKSDPFEDLLFPEETGQRDTNQPREASYPQPRTPSDQGISHSDGWYPSERRMGPVTVTDGSRHGDRKNPHRTSNETTPPTPRVDAAAERGSGESGEGGQIARFWEEMLPQHRPRTAKRVELDELLRTTLKSWPPEQLANEIQIDWPTSTRSITGLLRHRLLELPEEPPARSTSKPKAAIPPWCGECDPNTRTTHNDGWCPTCHPRSAGKAPARPEEPTSAEAPLADVDGYTVETLLERGVPAENVKYLPSRYTGVQHGRRKRGEKREPRQAFDALDELISRPTNNFSVN